MLNTLTWSCGGLEWALIDNIWFIKSSVIMVQDHITKQKL